MDFVSKIRRLFEASLKDQGANPGDAGAVDGRRMHDVLDGVRLNIGYEDKDGIFTERMITCKRLVDDEDGARLLAFCHLRRLDRAFFLSRISRISLADYSEHFDDIDAFFKTITDMHQTSDEDKRAVTDRLISEIGAELQLLAYIAQADTNLHEEEDGLVAVYMRGRAEELGHQVSAHYDHTAAMDWFHKQSPDLKTIQSAVEEIAKSSPENLKRLWQIAARLMESDGEVTAQELDRLHKLGSLIDEALGKLP
ncbi:MAG: hypothetical protein ACR2OJ_05055 [Hyphomicrobiales bacterium]